MKEVFIKCLNPLAVINNQNPGPGDGIIWQIPYYPLFFAFYRFLSLLHLFDLLNL